MAARSNYNLFSSLARSGNVEILGDPAVRTDIPEDVVKYIDQGYSIAEEIKLGVTGRQEISAAPNANTSQTQAFASLNISSPFKALLGCIPSRVALYVMIVGTKIGPIDLIESDEVCGEVFSEVSLCNTVRWPTVQTGQNIVVTLGNTNDSAPVEPRFSLTGIRLRK